MATSYKFFIYLILFLYGCKSGEKEIQVQTQLKYDLMIAYNVLENDETDDYEIYIMNLDGSGKKNISNSISVDWVYYSYDDKIYFLSDRDTTKRKYFLYEMDYDGENIRRISKFLLNDSYFSSRKEGSEFVVSSSKDGNSEIYIIDIEGNELARLTENNYYDSDPYFSPDGNQVVFRSIRNGIDELWLMNSDGSNQTQLTQYPENDSSITGKEYHAGPPEWEPTTNMISFASKQEGFYNIYTIMPDGTQITRLSPDSSNQMYHSWGPFAGALVYDNQLPGETNYNIYLANFVYNAIDQLTDSPKIEVGPVFVKKFRELIPNK